MSDEGSHLIPGCDSMKIDFQDARFQLHQQMNVDYEQCPTVAHHMHGKVEKKQSKPSNYQYFDRRL